MANDHVVQARVTKQIYDWVQAQAGPEQSVTAWLRTALTNMKAEGRPPSPGASAGTPSAAPTTARVFAVAEPDAVTRNLTNGLRWVRDITGTDRVFELWEDGGPRGIPPAKPMTLGVVMAEDWYRRPADYFFLLAGGIGRWRVLATMQRGPVVEITLRLE